MVLLFGLLIVYLSAGAALRAAVAWFSVQILGGSSFSASSRLHALSLRLRCAVCVLPFILSNHTANIKRRSACSVERLSECASFCTYSGAACAPVRSEKISSRPCRGSSGGLCVCKYPAPVARNRSCIKASGMEAFNTYKEKFGKGTPSPSALRSWARCRLIVTGSGARFWLACAVSSLSGGLGFKAAPIVIFLSGVPESVKSLCHIMPKMRPNLPAVVGLVFSW